MFDLLQYFLFGDGFCYVWIISIIASILICIWKALFIDKEIEKEWKRREQIVRNFSENNSDL